MRHELFEEGKRLVAFAAENDPLRRMIGYNVYRHGMVEVRVVEKLFREHPEFLDGLPQDDAEYGAAIHDSGKIVSTRNPLLWLTHGDLFTPDDFRQTAAHVDEGLALARRARDAGFYMPEIALTIIRYHETAGDMNLPAPVRAMVITDNLVAWCEDRRHRHSYQQLSFRDAWNLMHQKTGAFDRTIMDALWNIFSGHPQSSVKGLGWVWSASP